MSLAEIIIIAIGLSMDSFAVSVSSGAVMKAMTWVRVGKIAFFLAFFQSVMPILGYAAGISFVHHIQAWDHWVAFGLLGLLGGKMLQEGFTPPKEKDCDGSSSLCHPWRTRVLVGLSIATSIDAAAAGISFSFLNVNILHAALIIFLTTAAFAVGGMWIGTRFGKRFRKRAEVVGGFILLGIGVKILVEHMFFG